MFSMTTPIYATELLWGILEKKNITQERNVKTNGNLLLNHKMRSQRKRGTIRGNHYVSAKPSKLCDPEWTSSGTVEEITLHYPSLLHEPII